MTTYHSNNATQENVINLYLDSLSKEDRKELKEELYYNIEFNRSFKEAISRLANMIESLLTNKHQVLEQELAYFIDNFQTEHPFTRKMRLNLLNDRLDNESFALTYNLPEPEVHYKMTLLKQYISKPLLITNGDLPAQLRKIGF